MGSSGSGKTTVLRMLCKLISPTKGHITYNGQDLNQIDSVRHRRKVMLLSQNPVFFEGDIKENLYAGFRLQNRPLPEDGAIADVLELVNLKIPVDRTVTLLSGGEKQRLGLARMLLLNPDVYLLDEPSSALDKQTEDTVIGMLTERTKEEGKTMIMVTHSGTAAKKYSDCIITLSGGKVCLGGEGN